MAVAGAGLRDAQHRDAARRAVHDGRAFDVLRAGEVRPAAGGAAKTRSWSAATRWSRWERSSRSCSARSRPACWPPTAACGAITDDTHRASRSAGFADQPGDSDAAPGGAGPAHRLAAVDLDAGTTSAPRANRAPCSCRSSASRGSGSTARWCSRSCRCTRRMCSAAASRSSRCCWSLFSAGIGIGSLLCERLSGRKVEIGLVPFGSIGLTVFAVDLYFATPTRPPAQRSSAAQFVAAAGLVARADGPRPDRRVRRLLHRAALRARAAALAARGHVAGHRREQHPERACSWSSPRCLRRGALATRA